MHFGFGTVHFWELPVTVLVPSGSSWKLLEMLRKMTLPTPIRDRNRSSRPSCAQLSSGTHRGDLSALQQPPRIHDCETSSLKSALRHTSPSPAHTESEIQSTLSCIPECRRTLLPAGSYTSRW